MEETSPKHQNVQNPQHQSPLPSPNSPSSSSSSSTSANNNGFHHHHNSGSSNQPPLPSPKPISRSDSTNPYPTTFVQADTYSFKQVVQMLTGSPKPSSTGQPDPSSKSHAHSIPPIKSMPKKTQPSSGFKLYERRNSLKNLKINPLNPIFAPPSSGFSPRKPEILSPSILDFPTLVLSPVTPLIPDPFDRSGPTPTYSNCYSHLMNNHNSNNNNNAVVNGSDYNNNKILDAVAEEKAIKEKGFYLHPSPATTPIEAEPPRLLPLFPVTSPRVSGAANPPS